MNNRRVLVTGGAGFIGSHLVDLLLADGASRVVVVDNFFLGTRENLADAQAADGALCIIHENAEDLPAMREIIEREEIQDVFNLATKALEYSFDNPAGAARVNTDIALTLGELLRKGHYERLFHTSSSEVFGTARERPMTEDHPRNPTTPYAAGKAGADLILQSYARTFDLDIRIVRPFNNYGPRQNTGRYAGIVPLTMERLLAGKAPILHGDGSQGRDFVFVRDVARGLLTVAACPDARGQEFNLASGIETSVLELLETLCRVAGFDGEWIREDRRTADVDHHIGDGNRLAEVTGFRPPTSLEEGLESTWKWYASAAGGSP